jgi:hypothetical protein
MVMCMSPQQPDGNASVRLSCVNIGALDHGLLAAQIMRPPHRSHDLLVSSLLDLFSTESGLIRASDPRNIAHSTMQSGETSRLGDSPDYEAESSFPERHLDVEDKPPPFSGAGAGSDSYPPASVTKRSVFEPPTPAMLPLHQQWSANHSPLLIHADRHVSIIFFFFSLSSVSTSFSRPRPLSIILVI